MCMFVLMDMYTLCVLRLVSKLLALLFVHLLH